MPWASYQWSSTRRRWPLRSRTVATPFNFRHRPLPYVFRRNARTWTPGPAAIVSICSIAPTSSNRTPRSSLEIVRGIKTGHGACGAPRPQPTRSTIPVHPRRVESVVRRRVTLPGAPPLQQTLTRTALILAMADAWTDVLIPCLDMNRFLTVARKEQEPVRPLSKHRRTHRTILAGLPDWRPGRPLATPFAL